MHALGFYEKRTGIFSLLSYFSLLCCTQRSALVFICPKLITTFYSSVSPQTLHTAQCPHLHLFVKYFPPSSLWISPHTLHAAQCPHLHLFVKYIPFLSLNFPSHTVRSAVPSFSIVPNLLCPSSSFSCPTLHTAQCPHLHLSQSMFSLLISQFPLRRCTQHSAPIFICL